MKKILCAVLLMAFVATSSFAAWNQFVLLSGVTEASNGSAVRVDSRNKKTCYIIASGVSTGATVTIETSYNGSNWATVATANIIEDGTTEVAIVGILHKYIRAVTSSVSDGTYTVIMGVE